MVEKIRYIWDSIPTQLAKGNKKFIYGLVREGAREYEDALMWLTDAGEILRTYNVVKLDVPLKAYADLKSYKERYSPSWSLRTSLLPYECNENAKTTNIPLYMLFALAKEID